MKTINIYVGFDPALKLSIDYGWTLFDKIAMDLLIFEFIV